MTRPRFGSHTRPIWGSRNTFTDERLPHPLGSALISKILGSDILHRYHIVILQEVVGDLVDISSVDIVQFLEGMEQPLTVPLPLLGSLLRLLDKNERYYSIFLPAVYSLR